MMGMLLLDLAFRSSPTIFQAASSGVRCVFLPLLPFSASVERSWKAPLGEKDGIHTLLGEHTGQSDGSLVTLSSV